MQVYPRLRLGVGLIDHNNKITKVLPKLDQCFNKAKLKLYEIFPKYVKEQNLFLYKRYTKTNKVSNLYKTMLKLSQTFTHNKPRSCNMPKFSQIRTLN